MIFLLEIGGEKESQGGTGDLNVNPHITQKPPKIDREFLDLRICSGELFKSK